MNCLNPPDEVLDREEDDGDGVEKVNDLGDKVIIYNYSHLKWLADEQGK